MKLYSYWRSTAAYRVRIALNLKNTDYEISSVNLVEKAQSTPKYLEINAQALVPSLTVDGVTLTQSAAIVEYLEEVYPQPPLLPSDPSLRAAVRSFAQVIACDVHPLNNLRVLNYLRSELAADDAAVDQWYKRWIASGFGALETKVAETRGTYCFGDNITMADVFLVPQMYNANRFECDVTPYPHLCEIAATLEAQEAFARAAPHNQPDAPAARP